LAASFGSPLAEGIDQLQRDQLFFPHGYLRPADAGSEVVARGSAAFLQPRLPFLVRPPARTGVASSTGELRVGISTTKETVSVLARPARASCGPAVRGRGRCQN
jgi:hypothetical protein